MYKLLILLLLLTACYRPTLNLQTDYISKHQLASFIVNTPDPSLFDPPIGQRLILTCSIPKKLYTPQGLWIYLKIRFRNFEQIEKKIKVCSPSGTYIYSILNQEFLDKKGILTFQAQLFYHDQILEEWKHQLWTELITFDPPSVEESSEDESVE